MENKDPHNVGVDETPDPRFAFGQFAVQASILQGDRGLRGQQFKHGHALRREHVGDQPVLQIK